MPPDTSRRSSLRGTRKSSSNHDEELIIKRMKGEISCAECKRLKLKCDKKVPCGSCERRGCPNICPNGELNCKELLHRFILADTKDLHRKITEMSHRIHQLEDGLAVSHSNQSNERHPLLCEELLEIKFWPEKEAMTSQPQESDNTAVERSLDAFGTLTIGVQGEAKYFGGSAGSEVGRLPDIQIGASLGWDDSEHDDHTSFLPETVRDAVHELVWTELPPQMRAWALCEAYFEHAQWFLSAVSRNEVVNDYMAPIYKIYKERGRPKYSPNDNSEANPHRLGVLYFIFALGALMDMTLPPANAEAEKYFRLGRAAMSLRSLMDAPLLETVQGVAMMSAYHHMSGTKASLDSAWSLTALSVKLAQSVNRDCARWGLDSKTVEKRRNTFWSMMAADGFLSLHTGRPPACPLVFVDCEFPEDTDQTIDEDGKPQMGYQRCRFHIMKNCMLPVAEQMAKANGPDYKTLLELDAKILQLPTPKNYRFLVDPEERERPSSIARAYLLSQFRLNTLMFIHRSFFAQAVLDHPMNPFRSPYAPSYLTAYRCASAQIASSIHFYNRLPEMFIRLTSFWTHAFTGALIVGFVVSRTPHSGIATTAFIELNRAMDFFESTAHKNPRAFRALVILRKLKERAHRVYFESHSKAPSPSLLGSSSSGQTDKSEGPDELALFGGKTFVIPTPVLFQPPTEKADAQSMEGIVSPTPNHIHSVMQSVDSPPQNLGVSGTTSLPPPFESYMPSLRWPIQEQDSWFSSATTESIPSQLFTNLPTPQAPILEVTGAAVTGTTDISSLFGLPPDGSGSEWQWASLFRDTGLLDGSQQQVQFEDDPTA
ncbi:hypothetical protein NEOLEDRAFT_1056777 [Neolentinus lepideus HHB14362 ss-1]|uniref:Zn(2)-C6 fungal-type domain-containing protein n=1 Tax=Neolentinus lepideus HHB14362 ss-1 TaxID=1314782 RepID=A0A165VDT8_9AGAM|nr:hypothetical protein NEOLEDRAFT_1056777 [Neolentinus lepideus HHB14362 ss-1]